MSDQNIIVSNLAHKIMQIYTEQRLMNVVHFLVSDFILYPFKSVSDEICHQEVNHIYDYHELDKPSEECQLLNVSVHCTNLDEHTHTHMHTHAHTQMHTHTHTHTHIHKHTHSRLNTTDSMSPLENINNSTCHVHIT